VNAAETTSNHFELPADLVDRTLLIVDDDRPLLTQLERAMQALGFEVTKADSVANSIVELRRRAPAFAVIELRLRDGSGLDVIAALRQQRPGARAVVVTAYGSIATAVNAVKVGAVDYLAKPTGVNDVMAALLAPDDSKANPPARPMSAARVRWEHIQRIYELCNHDMTQTARRLKMHRRSLQRILTKHAPR
jgi:two-component system, response regulator RegA